MRMLLGAETRLDVHACAAVVETLSRRHCVVYDLLQSQSMGPCRMQPRLTLTPYCAMFPPAQR